MSSTTFDPNSIRSQSGRVFFVTGGTAGLGAQAISLIASADPERIYFSGRNSKKANAVIENLKRKYPRIDIRYLECDNSSLVSVRACAQEFLAQEQRLDVLMCNAGIMAWDPSLSKDGYEIQFATNHLGHALLIKLLLPVMERTASEPSSDVRIVSLSSTGYASAPPCGIDFGSIKTTQAHLGPLYVPGKWARYGQSKLANLLYARSLAKHHPSIASVAIHPGYIRTDLFQQTNFVDRIPVYVLGRGQWLSVEQGCWNQTWAATTEKSSLENGAYYQPQGKKTTPETKQGKDDELAEKLWKWTEEALKDY